MGSLNYFEPYQSKTVYHEDQLTRALLVVLRHSPAALQFFSRVTEDALQKTAERVRKSVLSLPAFHELPLDKVSMATQVGSLQRWTATQVLSVLLTDEAFGPKESVQVSERGARYDGLIKFGDDLLLIIENKPRMDNVWEEQLNPNLMDMAVEEVDLVPIPAIVEWCSVIKGLKTLSRMVSFAGAERIIVGDFLDYVSKHYEWLNPYDNLSDCGCNGELIQRRIGNILGSIVTDLDAVQWRAGWAWALHTGFPSLRMLGVELHMQKPETYDLALSLYYGDTQSQAQALYDAAVPFAELQKLIDADWECTPLFHLSFMQSHLVYFSTSPDNGEKYWHWWQDNIGEIRQRAVEEIEPLLRRLEGEGVIEISAEKWGEVEKRITGTERKRINICPCMLLQYKWSSASAMALDRDVTFEGEIARKVIQGTGLVCEKPGFVKTKKQKEGKFDA